MPPARALSTIRLVNGALGDPVLYLDYPSSDDALLFDAGDNAALSLSELGDLEAVFITHHHVDHFVGLDRIVRANLDHDKTLHVFGPPGTIARVSARVRSYEYPFFPFMKLTITVHDLDFPQGIERTGSLSCQARFAEPSVSERPLSPPKSPGGPVVCYSTEFLEVEALPVRHTVPCLAYALVERPGLQFDPAKLARSPLRAGDWLGEVRRLLAEGADAATPLDIAGGRYTLGALTELAFAETPGARVAYVTDTVWHDELRPNLVKLCQGAFRLYCDSFYAVSQSKDALKHHHMQSVQSAELAKLAKVERLVLMHLSSRYHKNPGQLLDEAQAVFARVEMG